MRRKARRQTKPTRRKPKAVNGKGRVMPHPVFPLVPVGAGELPAGVGRPMIQSRE